MSDVAPSRSAILELRDERQAMVEGHAFLDEKCLAIAAEIVRELARYAALERDFLAASQAAARALQAAIARHGLAELRLHPAPATCGARPAQRVALGDGGEAPRVPVSRNSRGNRKCRTGARPRRAPATPPSPPCWRWPRAVGSSAGNLERLSEEYRRSIRRARALDDVLIPEAARELSVMETALEDLEREDAIAMRLGARAGM